LALAKLLLAPPNLLLMDEPTTHLDMASIDALINALRQYTGTLVFISHDVHFIRHVAEQVLHVNAGQLTAYAGNFDYYLEKSKAGDARAAVERGGSAAATPVPAEPRDGGPGQPAARSGPKSKEQRRLEAEARAARSAPLRAARAKVQQLEKEIASLESRQSELTAALEAPETYSEPGKPHALNRELATVVDRLATLTGEWERASTEVASMED
jgi:ATP-binding cassette subfamily F protein 3